MTETKTVWTSLPDPRVKDIPEGKLCDISIHESAVRHITKRHLKPSAAERHAWEGWISARLVSLAIDALNDKVGSTVGQQVTFEVAAAMEPMVKATFHRPFLLLESRALQSLPKRPTNNSWIAVLPNGAKMILRLMGKRPILVTAFFPSRVLKRAPGNRWRITARNVLQKRLVFDVPLRMLRLPDKADCCVVTPATWGFHPELVGCPWRGNFAPWFDAEQTLRRNEPFRLKPKRKPNH